MSRSQGRAQVDPLPALVAVAAVGLGLSAYAGVLADAVQPTGGPDAERALDEVRDAVSTNGVVRPGRLDGSALPTPGGRQLNATVVVGDERWSAGPMPRTGAPRASARIPVAVAPGNVSAGRLRVVVW